MAVVRNVNKWFSFQYLFLQTMLQLTDDSQNTVLIGNNLGNIKKSMQYWLFQGVFICLLGKITGLQLKSNEFPDKPKYVNYDRKQYL
jgi:hypothetical protein